MARIAEMQKMDRSGYDGAEEMHLPPDVGAIRIPHPHNFPDFVGVSPFMLSSLPTIASSYDQFSRQFYGSGSFPSLRVLPLGL